MKATVEYNENGEPFRIKIDTGQLTVYDMEGSTAVCTKVRQHTGEEYVYIEDLQETHDYVESLPFVQAVER